MERQASLDLLNATHTFPCEFTIKVIGANNNNFVQRCIDAVQDAAPHPNEIPHTTRSTPNGRHIAVTLQPTLQSAEHVLAVYASVKVVQGVVMTM